MSCEYFKENATTDEVDIGGLIVTVERLGKPVACYGECVIKNLIKLAQSYSPEAMKRMMQKGPYPCGGCGYPDVYLTPTEQKNPI